MTDIILGVLHMCIFPGGLFALAVGLLVKGLDRRVEARLQRRVGPPLIQPLLDIAKLLTKETLIPKTAVRSVFLAAPVVGFAGMAVCAAFIPVPGVFQHGRPAGALLPAAHPGHRHHAGRLGLQLAFRRHGLLA